MISALLVVIFLCLCADVWLKGTVNHPQHRLLATERVIGLGASNQVPSFSAAPWCAGWRSLRYVVENKSSADEVGLLSSLAPIQYYSSPISLLASIYSAATQQQSPSFSLSLSLPIDIYCARNRTLAPLSLMRNRIFVYVEDGADGVVPTSPEGTAGLFPRWNTLESNIY
jgi:hypothetical protein